MEIMGSRGFPWPCTPTAVKKGQIPRDDSLRLPSAPGCRALAGTGTAATTGATTGLAAEKLAPRQGWFNGWGTKW